LGLKSNLTSSTQELFHNVETDFNRWYYRCSGDNSSSRLQQPHQIEYNANTDHQGGSVAKAFLKGSSYKTRGVTRDSTKAESQALIAQGIEIVKEDVEDFKALKSAFKGVHTIRMMGNS
jgi:hypothetical protein